MKHLRIPSLFLVALLSGCALFGGKAVNPVSAADTPEQKAYALYGTFVVFEELGADAVEDPSISSSIKQGIRTVDARLKPAADCMLKASTEVARIRAEIQAGAVGSGERLRIAAENLGRWVSTVSPLVSNLILAIQGRQPTPTPGAPIDVNTCLIPA